MVSANGNGLERLLMVEEVAELLRVPVSWVYRYADELGAYHVGKYLRFSFKRVLEGLERCGKAIHSADLKPNNLLQKAQKREAGKSTEQEDKGKNT